LHGRFLNHSVLRTPSGSEVYECRTKMHGWKIQDWKYGTKIAGTENAGPT